ncbi:MAG: sugar MFS transporter [Flavobacteriaceae bacterium]|nr:sugar MFS transporter [Flavobacteriaceae bacterium]
MNTTKKSFTSAFIFVTLLFFLWGFITVLVDSLIPRLKEVFTLNYAQSSLVQLAFFGAFFVLAIPSGFILKRIGYQKGIVLGLFVMASGCLLFYPAASLRTFGIFMLAYFVLAAGITILQVAVNPYVSVLGAESGASSRLNLAQAFNSFGTLLAPIFGSILILSDTVKTKQEIAILTEAEKTTYLTNEALAVQSPFLGITILIVVLAIVFFIIKLPKILEEQEKIDFGSLFKHKNLLLGSLGIFFYVGAEVAIGSYLVNYFLEMNLYDTIKGNGTMMGIANSITNIFNISFDNRDPKALLGIFVTFYWGSAMIGRFIGAYLTKIVSPKKVLALFAILAIGMILISINSTGLVLMWSILAVGLFNSIMFPTIFTTSIEGLGNLKPHASGLLCTMIVGGALIPPVFGWAIDGFGFKLAFIVAIVCYLYIIFYANSEKLIKKTKSNVKP